MKVLIEISYQEKDIPNLPWWAKEAIKEGFDGSCRHGFKVSCLSLNTTRVTPEESFERGKVKLDGPKRDYLDQLEADQNFEDRKIKYPY